MRFLAASLLANLVLLAALALRPALAPPAVSEFLARRLHFGTAPAADAASRGVESSSTAVAGGLPSSASTKAPLLGAAFATDDFTALTARMRAAGFPAGVIAEIARREIDARYEARLAALMLPDPNTPFWKTSPDAIATASRKSVQISQLLQERDKAYRDAVNDPFFFQDSALDIGQRRMWGDLPRAKLDRIQRIEDDYADMISAARTSANGVLLAEDREKLDLLEREKQFDIAALLSPEEVAEYRLRTGSNGVASRLRLFNPSEAEYRIVAQANLDANGSLNSSGGPPPTPEQRREALQTFGEKMTASLGEARYADFLVTTTPEFQTLSQIAEADRLPANTTRQAFSLRDLAAQESSRIFDDPKLDAEQKRASLQMLAQNTRNQLLAILGPTSGPAYVKIANSWLNNIGNGSAVSFIASTPLGGTFPTYRRLPGTPSTAPVPSGVIIRSP